MGTRLARGTYRPRSAHQGNVPPGSAPAHMDTPRRRLQITSFLREALGATPPDQPTSHSMKTTCLTWAAACNVGLGHRRLLGHHVHDSARSAETYNRQILLPAARALEEVLLAIRSGRFRPDQPTGLQFDGPGNSLQLQAPDPAVVGLPPPLPVAEVPPTATDTESPSDSSSAASHSDTEDDADLPDQLRPLEIKRSTRPALTTLPSDHVAWSHRGSGCLHITPATSAHASSVDVPAPTATRIDIVTLYSGQPHCKQCWSHRSFSV